MCGSRSPCHHPHAAVLIIAPIEFTYFVDSDEKEAQRACSLEACIERQNIHAGYWLFSSIPVYNIVDLNRRVR